VTRQSILFATITLLAACASYQPRDDGGLSGSDDGEHSQKAVVNKSGFSGYGWGSSIEFIADSMEVEAYDLLERDDRSLWYRGTIADEPLQIGYVFENEILIEGIWILDDVDRESYWAINHLLENEYNSTASVETRGDDFLESEFQPEGTNARIVHELDVIRDQHVVRYYFQSEQE